MEFITEYITEILSIVGTIASAAIALTSLLKALKSEKRVNLDVAEAKSAVNEQLLGFSEAIKVTRAGIVQGFKDAVITKDLKVSVNTQVEKLINTQMDKVIEIIKKGEERRTQLTYWALKVLKYTAAYDKLTVEQQSELDEVMALIAEDERIVDTIN